MSKESNLFNEKFQNSQFTYLHEIGTTTTFILKQSRLLF